MTDNMSNASSGNGGADLLSTDLVQNKNCSLNRVSKDFLLEQQVNDSLTHVFTNQNAIEFLEDDTNLEFPREK